MSLKDRLRLKQQDQKGGIEQEVKKSNEFKIADKYKSYVSKDALKPHLSQYQKQNNIKVLMVAEKPSIARDIFEALSGKRGEKEKGGGVMLSFNGNFFHHGAYFVVTSVKGHVFERDFPKSYQNWEKTDPLELFDVDTVKQDCDSGSTTRTLERLSKDVDVILLWLDNDREGENISFEILDAVHKNLNARQYKQIYRVKFSSLVKRDLVEAF